MVALRNRRIYRAAGNSYAGWWKCFVAAFFVVSLLFAIAEDAHGSLIVDLVGDKDQNPPPHPDGIGIVHEPSDPDGFDMRQVGGEVSWTHDVSSELTGMVVTSVQLDIGVVGLIDQNFGTIDNLLFVDGIEVLNAFDNSNDGFRLYSFAIETALLSDGILNVVLDADEQEGWGGPDYSELIVTAAVPEPPTIATWIAGDGNWSTAANWDTNSVPNNAGLFTTFHAIIPSGNPTIDEPIELAAITVGSNDLGAPQAVLNLNAAITTQGDLNINKSGEVQSNGATLSSLSGSLVNQGLLVGSLTNIETDVENLAEGTMNLSFGTLASNVLNQGQLSLADVSAAGTISNVSGASVVASEISPLGESRLMLENSGQLSIQHNASLLGINNLPGGVITFDLASVNLQQTLENHATILAFLSEISRQNHDKAQVIIRNLGSELIGTLDAEGSFEGGATSLVSPGVPIGEILFQGNYTDQGTLLIQIGGTEPLTEYDRLSVGMTATLDGTVRVELIDLADPDANLQPFAPEFGQVFDVLVAEKIDITAVTIELPELNGSLGWSYGIVDLGGEFEALRLRVDPVPEPATWIMLILGVAALLIKRRRLYQDGCVR